MKGIVPVITRQHWIFDYIDDDSVDGIYLLTMAEDGSRTVSDRLGKQFCNMSAIQNVLAVITTRTFFKAKALISTTVTYMHSIVRSISLAITLGLHNHKFTQVKLNRIPIVLPRIALLEHLNAVS